MNQNSLQALAQYNSYANTVVLDTVTKLSVEELSAAPSPSRGSILILIHHIFVVEADFLAQCRGRVFQFDPQSLTTLEQLRAFAQEHAENLEPILKIGNSLCIPLVPIQVS